MLQFLKDIVKQNTTREDDGGDPIYDAKRAQIATCALFLEVANSDDDFTQEERKLIFDLMKQAFDLTEAEVKNLIDLSEEQIRKSVSLYEFTDIINQNYSRESKLEIVKNLWRLIFIDDKLDKYEDYFIRKISNNLHLSHQDLIAAKLSVREESKDK